MHFEGQALSDERTEIPNREKAVKGWLFLAGAIAAEITGTILLDYSEGFRLPIQTTTALTFYAVSFYVLTHALRSIALSIAYATWSGTGTVAVAIAGVFLHNEVVSWGRAAGIAAVIGGVILLNFANRPAQPPRDGLSPKPDR